MGKLPKSGHPEDPAIVIMEKTPFGGEETVKKVVFDCSSALVEYYNDLAPFQIVTGSTTLKASFCNDIYGKYDCLIRPEEANMVKVSVIHPATKKHIR